MLLQDHIYNSRKARGKTVAKEGTNCSELAAARREVAREIRERVAEIRRKEKESDAIMIHASYTWSDRPESIWIWGGGDDGDD